MKVHFAKLSATGNDFILFDHVASPAKDYDQTFLEHLCHRQKGVGADGILILEPSEKTDFRMRYFNADGAEAEMCGNGARASAWFAVHNKLAPENCRFEVCDDVYEASVAGDVVSLLMHKPKKTTILPGALEHSDFEEGGFCWVGVPHYVIFSQNLAAVNVEKIGKHYCKHAFFAPHGTNVNFIEIVDERTLKIRTYERGVNAETLACGTGAVASAYISAECKKVEFPVMLYPPGGELVISIDAETDRPRLQGTVSQPFTGEAFANF